MASLTRKDLKFESMSDGLLWSGPLLANIAPHLSDLEGKTILILGAGNGNLAVFLSSYGASVFAIDKCISQTWKYHKSIYYIRGDNESLPFTDNLFDMTISCSTFQYVDHESVFNEIVRTSKNTAIVLLNENLPDNPIIKLYRARRKLKSSFNLKAKNYVASIKKYITPQSIKHDEIVLEGCKHYYLISVLNYLLLKSDIEILATGLTCLLTKFDDFIIRNFKITRRFCWFCTYKLRVVKPCQLARLGRESP